MAIIKCKMCGGDLVLLEGQSVAECEYCGSRQTVPTADNEKKMLQFERAERLRRNCEFDKAAGLYETIVAEFRQEAEAYWGLVLCKYGIEYVDDPATGKKIPTCHRSSFDSIMEDSDFELALENADAMARRVYREEAKQIEELRKGIIAVSANEQPYDIFICYKETDEFGQRTLDSVLAQDIYDALTGKGYRTFFSRITLEEKLGQEYEPYIFAALNSAKIMLAVGTDYEYYNAVWVKNEWSRYLKLMAKDKTKHLIPCFKGIDAYDMPREFAKLQAQDLGKMGAIQDILRGVEKLLPRKAAEPRQETVAVRKAAEESPTDPLLQRAFLFLEDGNWSRADEYCEKVLDMNPKCAEAYLGKMLAELKVNRKEDLAGCTASFGSNEHFRKVLRFADPALKAELEKSLDFVDSMIESTENSDIVNGVLRKYKGSQSRVILPRSIKAIGKDAFYGCRNLKTIEIPDSVTEIGSGVFSGCENLTEIRLSGKNPNFRASGTCLVDRRTNTVISGLRFRDVPTDGSIRRIGENAFLGSKEITEIVIPEGVTEIGKEAFADCNQLTTVVLPASIAVIASDAIPHNPGIRIRLGEENPVFRTAGSCLIHKETKTVIFGTRIQDLPDDGSVTGIGEYAFCGCEMPEALEIPACISAIGAYAFAGCGNLAELTFLGRTVKIADNAFDRENGNLTIYAFADSDAANWAKKNRITTRENEEMKRISTAALLDKGNLALQDGDFNKAAGFFDNALGNDAQSAVAYLGKTLVQERCNSLGVLVRQRAEAYRHVSTQTLHIKEDTEHIEEMVARYSLPGYVDEKSIRELYRFDLSYTSEVSGRQQQYLEAASWWKNHRLLSHAEKYAEGELAEQLQREKNHLLNQMNQRIQSARAAEAMNLAKLREAYAAHLAEADQAAERIYNEGIALREKQYRSLVEQAQRETDPRKLKALAENFVSFGEYRDCGEQAQYCRDRAVEEQKKLAAEKEQRRAANAEKKKARRKKARPIIALVAIITVVCLVLTGPLPRRNTEQAEAPEQLQSSQPTETVAAETQQTEPEHSPEAMQYEEAARLEAEGQLGQAAIAFGKLGDYRDARARSFALWDKVAIRRTVAVGDYHTLALKNDGTVLATGSNVTGKNQVTGFEYHMEEEEHPCKVEDWTDIVAVAASTGVSYGLKADGTVVTTKLPDEWSKGYDHWKDIVAISDDGRYGLKMDGTLVTDNDSYDFSGWTDLIAVYPVSGAYPYVSVVVGFRADGTYLMATPKQMYEERKVPDVKNWENVVAFASGTGFEYTLNMALKEDGTVVATGTNNLGQCKVQDWRDVIQIEAGGEFCALGLKSDGTVVTAGRLPAWYNPTNWSDVLAIAASGQHVVGLKPDGTLVVTGSSTHGRCDVGDWADIKLPGALHTAAGASRSEPVIDYAAAYLEAENLLASGETVKAAIAFGKLGDYEDSREQSLALWDSLRNKQTISAGRIRTMAVRENGNVLTTDGTRLGGGIVAVSDGNWHYMGLRRDGTVDAKTTNDLMAGLDGGTLFTNVKKTHIRDKQQKNIVGTWKNIQSVSAGDAHTVGLCTDGTAVATGDNHYSRCEVGDWTDLVAVSAGYDHTVGLRSDGTVLSTGGNKDGLPDTTSWTDIKDISAGKFFTVGLQKNGNVIAAGNNEFGQCDVSDWSDVVAVSAGNTHTVALLADGTVVAVGGNEYGQCNVNGWHDIVAIDAGSWHTVGLRSDGTLVAVGLSKEGRCDVGTWTNIKLPQ